MKRKLTKLVPVEMELTDLEIKAYEKKGFKIIDSYADGGIYKYGNKTYKKVGNDWSVSVNGIWTPLSKNVESRSKELNKNAKFVRELTGYNPNKPVDYQSRLKPEAASTLNVAKKTPPIKNLTQIKKESNYEVDKKNLENDFNKTIKYYEDYHESPMYKKMLSNSVGSSDAFSFIGDNRKSNLESIETPTVLRVQPIDKGGTGGWSEGSTGNITITPEGYSVQGILPHEISHSIDRPAGFEDKRLIPYRDINAITKMRPKSFINSPAFDNLSDEDKDALLNNKNENKKYLEKANEWINYVGEPTETRARLNDIRMQSKFKGLYDPFTQKVTPSIYKKLLNTPFEKEENEGFDTLQQLKEIYSDEEIQWMLNNISKNDENNKDVPYAKLGGVIFKPTEMELTQKEIDAYLAKGIKVDVL